MRIDAIYSYAGRSSCQKLIRRYRRRQCAESSRVLLCKLTESGPQESRLRWRHLDSPERKRLGASRSGRRVERHQAPIILPDAGKAGFMPPPYLVGKEVKRLVFLERAAEGGSCLHSRICRIRNRAERVYSLKVAIAQKTKNVTVEAIVARARDDIDYSARRASVLR